MFRFIMTIRNSILLCGLATFFIFMFMTTTSVLKHMNQKIDSPEEEQTNSMYHDTSIATFGHTTQFMISLWAGHGGKNHNH